MSMKIALSLQLETELFQLEEAKEAEFWAQQSDARLYSYQTSGNENWLQAGLFLSDTLGIVVLPKGLPDVIDLPNDSEE